MVIFDGENLNYYTKKDGLPSANLYNPTPDRKGNMIFSHPTGALIVKDNKFQTFYDVDLDISGGSNVATLDGNGNLVMHYKGLGLVVEKEDHRTYPLHLTSVSIDTSTYYYEYPKDLSHAENSIIFNFSALNFSDPKQTIYQYILEGYDNKWSRSSNLSFAQYQNLPPGKYNFKVKGITSNGVQTNEVKYAFVISPPFWKTWWAYSFYIFSFIGLLYFIRKAELKRQRKNSEIKESKLRAEAAELQAKAAEVQSRVIQAENERKTKELEQAKEIEKAYTELKSTQAQLIQSEKMASLGELTAGIAHEIKNPLNFVNNFSEISTELISEIEDELKKNDKEEVLSILKDLKQNLEKINQHGKRADSIVKGMLLHSRGTSGEKTLTDINDLLDQDVNLAYHGMRATNKEFNITIEKDYDKDLEKINVVPQDISRVFLNIINNACYAAYDRKKKGSDTNFSPILKVSTKKLDGKVEIRIGDNGNGIPKDIIDKIFQPFFTTKPTGEGTGLGLSLSYDIVTKVHGGELKVETNEGVGTEMRIILSQNM